MRARSSWPLVLLLAWGCASSQPTPDPAPPPASTNAAEASGVAVEAPLATVSSALVTLQQGDGALPDVLRRLGEQAGVPIAVEPDVGGRVGLSLVAQPWDEALAAVLFAARLHAVHEGAGLRVAARPLEGRAFSPPPPPASDSRPAPQPRPRSRPWPERTIDVDVEGAELTAVMELIGSTVGVAIAVDEQVRERVSVSLHGIPWREAVDVVARLARCEVEEQGESLLVRQPECCPTFQFTEADLRTVIQLMAAYAGGSIVLEPGVAAGTKLTMDVRGQPWLTVLEGIGRVTGLTIERRGGVLLVGTRPGWGTPDLDGRSPAAPEQPAQGARLTLHARGAPLRPLLQALAPLAGRSLLTGPLPSAWVDLDATGTGAELLARLFQAAGLETRDEGDLLLVLSARGPARTSPPKTIDLLLRDGRQLGLGLEATLAFEGEVEAESLAVIDGRRYRTGDALLDPTGPGELPVRLGYVGPDGLLLTGKLAEGDLRVPFP